MDSLRGEEGPANPPASHDGLGISAVMHCLDQGCALAKVRVQLGMPGWLLVRAQFHLRTREPKLVQRCTESAPPQEFLPGGCLECAVADE
jgi:hypothetical protein